jgi:DNA-directed RNA polymerase specialized sigma24 family protein
MTGEEAQARQIFLATVREAAFLAANGEAPPDRFWFYREARWRCLAAAAKSVQPETKASETASISDQAPEQIAQLDPEQIAVWISAAPEPQRSALALYYLDEFTLAELLSLLEMKAGEFSELICSGRRQFQAWLDSTIAYYGGEVFDAGQV